MICIMMRGVGDVGRLEEWNPSDTPQTSSRDPQTVSGRHRSATPKGVANKMAVV